MNNQYRMELTSMLSDLDTHLEEIFSHYGFYESNKLTKKEFKSQILNDYREMHIPGD